MRIPSILAPAAVLLLLAAPGFAIEFMSVDDVRPGMKGYGLTVFHGARPTTFSVELIGVLKGELGPRQDMILCRLEHPVLQDIGVVAGMSGSPVFIDGKLLGAVGYGYANSLQPIGGIAPIEDMIKVLGLTSNEPHRPDEFEAALRGATGPAPEPVRVDRHNAPEGFFADDAAAEVGGVLEPLSTALVVSSRSAETLRILQEAFQGRGVTIMQGGGGGASPQHGEISFEEIGNGYSLAIPLMTGDMTLQGTGTITYRDGDKLVAFGHPMDFLGDVRMPMAASWVHAIVPGRVRPIKLASAMNLIGTLRQDRLVAVGGVIGMMPTMIPIAVQVDAPGQSETQTFRFEAVPNRDLFPSLLRVAVSESVTAASSMSDEATADLSYRLELSNGEVIEKRDFLTGSFMSSMVAMGIASDASTLMNNPYERLGVKQASAEVRLTEKANEASLQALRPHRRVWRPGETVTVQGEILPWRQERVSFTMSLALPEHLPDGAYTLNLYDAASRQRLESTRAPGRSRIQTLDQLIARVREHYPRNRMYLTLEQVATGLTLKGEEFEQLPPSMIGALAASSRELVEPIQVNILAETFRSWHWQVTGSVRANIRVSRTGQEIQ